MGKAFAPKRRALLSFLAVSLIAGLGATPARSAPAPVFRPFFQAVTPGLVAYWNFDEGTGTTANDRSGNTNTGTLNAAQTYDNTNKPTLNVANPFALNFNGNGDQVIVATSTSLNPTAALTVAAMVRATDWASNRRILQKGNADNQYRLLVEAGVLKFHCTGLTPDTVTFATPPATGAWHFVAGVYDGANLSLYVDNTQVATLAATGAIATTADPLVIGNKPGAAAGNGDQFFGQMDEVRIYGRALTGPELTYLAAGNSVPVAPTGLGATPQIAPQIDLAWTATATVAPATTYTVRRGTVTTGPYGTTVGSTAALMLSDNGAAFGTTFFYVVAAVNFAGVGPNSTEVSSASLPVPPKTSSTGGNDNLAHRCGCNSAGLEAGGLLLAALGLLALAVAFGRRG